MYTLLLSFEPRANIMNQITQTTILFFGAILLTVGYGATECMHHWSYTTSIDTIVEHWNDRLVTLESHGQLESQVQPITIDRVLNSLRSEFAASNDDSVKQMLGSCIQTGRLPHCSWIKPTTHPVPTGAANYDFNSPVLHFSHFTASSRQQSPIDLNLSLVPHDCCDKTRIKTH